MFYQYDVFCLRKSTAILLLNEKMHCHSEACPIMRLLKHFGIHLVAAIVFCPFGFYAIHFFQYLVKSKLGMCEYSSFFNIYDFIIVLHVCHNIKKKIFLLSHTYVPKY